MLWLLIVLALVFAFLNGYRDSSSIIAGVVASQAMQPRPALLLAGAAEFAAPFLFGVAVARTLTTGLVDPQVISLPVVVMAMAAALLWTVFAWLRGVPSSSSHALVGGLLGSALLLDGPQALLPGGLVKVILPLFLAPLVGLGAGWLAMHALLAACAGASPRVNLLFRRVQVATLVGLALSHSANDAQKSMGIITLGLLLAGKISSFQVPGGVIFLCAVAIALGAGRGDWRLIGTLGRKLYRIRPANALASQGASAAIVMASALAGASVSTSQVLSMALLGAGAAERPNKVRWQVGGEMLATWVLTIPATMLLASLFIEASRIAHSLAIFITRQM